MVGSSTYGAPIWVDLSTPDVQGATRFYEKVLGWTVEKHSSPLGDYSICSAGDHEVGGMMAAPPEQAGLPAMWTVLFHVQDVDATLADVDEAGGKVMEPAFDLPDARIAIVEDPTGAVFGVISQSAPTGTWLSSAPGAVCWVELLTRDPAAAIDFYAHVFGWEASTGIYGDVRYTTFALDGADVAGAMMTPAEVPVEAPSQWSLYFAVEDCLATERQVEGLGGYVVKPTTPVGDGRFAVVTDPQAGTFQLMDQMH